MCMPCLRIVETKYGANSRSGVDLKKQELVNVLYKHQPTIGDIIFNKYIQIHYIISKLCSKYHPKKRPFTDPWEINSNITSTLFTAWVWNEHHHDCHLQFQYQFQKWLKVQITKPYWDGLKMVRGCSEFSMAISGTDWLEVATIYKAYFSGLCKGISPQNMALYGTVPPF